MFLSVILQNVYVTVGYTVTFRCSAGQLPLKCYLLISQVFRSLNLAIGFLECSVFNKTHISIKRCKVTIEARQNTELLIKSYMMQVK